jgi:TolB-like protein/DNA-binding winged helix-turn-helix (wHTH) protein/Flp pilus assembly protein TadD
LGDILTRAVGLFVALFYARGTFLENRTHAKSIVRFGVFEVDLRAGELRRQGLKIKIQEKPFQILATLLESSGEVVTREELRQRLWPSDVFVDYDNSLNAAITKLREALGDSADNPCFVETLPRHGYRFLAPVKRDTQVSPTMETLEEKTSPSIPRKSSPSIIRLVLGLATALIVVAFFAWLSDGPQSPSSVDRVMLAVLPLDNMSGNSEDEYFSTGLTEEMITYLGRLDPEQLGVIAHTSTKPYKDSHKSVAQIGEELHVDYVLEGSVRREDDRVRVTGQLIDVRDQTHLWAETYDRDLAKVFAIQSEIAARIAGSLRLKLLSKTPSMLASGEARNGPVHEAYLKGRYFSELATERGFRKGIDYFTQAIEQNPSYAPAYAGLAGCHCQLGGHGMELERPRKTLSKSKAAALKALELDGSLAEAHAVLGVIRLKYDWDWSGAEQAFKRAIDLNPSYAQAHLWYSLYFEVLGRSEEAINEARLALDLDPLSLKANVNLASQFYQARQYDRAIEQLKRGLELKPNFWGAHWLLGDTYERKGMYEKAISELKQAVILSGNNPGPLGSLGYTYALSGQREQALSLRNQLKLLAGERYVSPFNIALISIGLGEADLALEWLERAYEERSRSVVWLKVEARCDSLRSAPRFIALLDRIGFPS